MKDLLKFFLKHIFRISLLYLVFSFFSILLLNKIFGGLEFYIGMLLFVGPLVAWSLAFVLVPKNLDWLITLPISKKSIVVLHFINNVVATLAVSLASLIVIFAVTILQMNQNLSVEAFAKNSSSGAFGNAVRSHFLQSNFFDDLYILMTALLMLSLFVGLSFSVSRPTQAKKFFSNLFFHPNVYLKWFFRLGWIFFLLIAVFERTYLTSPVSLFFIASALFIFIPIFNTCFALALNKRYKFYAFSMGLLFILIQGYFLLDLANQHLKSSSYDKRTSAIIFLGSFSQFYNQENFKFLFQQDLDSDKFNALIDLYKQKYSKDQKITVETINNFTQIINSKTNIKSLSAVFNLIELSSLSFENAQLVFEKINLLTQECHCDVSPIDFLVIKFTPEQVLNLLKTPISFSNKVALFWLRYHRNSNAIFEVLSQFLRFDDKNKLEATKTLSLLVGKDLNLIAPFLDKAHKNYRFYDVRCDELNSKKIAVMLSSKDFSDNVKINLCLRSRFELTMASELEGLGWLYFPYDLKSLHIIKRYYKLK